MKTILSPRNIRLFAFCALALLGSLQSAIAAPVVFNASESAAPGDAVPVAVKPHKPRAALPDETNHPPVAAKTMGVTILTLSQYKPQV